MYINFQQNQVKTQVMTVPTRYQITTKEIGYEPAGLTVHPPPE